MKKILIYTSDHGFGHATRIIALSRNLFKTGRFEVVIKNSNAFNFIKSSLPNIRVERLQTDVGAHWNWNSNRIDVDKTFNNFYDWIKNEEAWISKETAYFKDNPADLILSDISPMATRLSEKVHCSSITIGNFSWIDILKNMPFHEKKGEVLKWLMESFSISQFAVKLPLSMSMEGFAKLKDASLLCRDTTSTKKQTFEELGLHSPPVVVYFGDQIPHQFKINKKHGTKILTMLPGRLLLSGRQIKSGHIEGQNIIAASTLVITKVGYSTLSECVKYRCPLYLIPMRDYPEDVVLSRQVIELGLARIIEQHESKFLIDIPDEEQIKSMKYAIKEESIKSLEKRRNPLDIIHEVV